MSDLDLRLSSSDLQTYSIVSQKIGVRNSVECDERQRKQAPRLRARPPDDSCVKYVQLVPWNADASPSLSGSRPPGRGARPGAIIVNRVRRPPLSMCLEKHVPMATYIHTKLPDIY